MTKANKRYLKTFDQIAAAESEIVMKISGKKPVKKVRSECVGNLRAPLQSGGAPSSSSCSYCPARVLNIYTE